MVQIPNFPFVNMVQDAFAIGAIFLNNEFSGTGFVLNDDHHVCTCAHVVTVDNKPFNSKDEVYFCSSDGNAVKTFPLSLEKISPDYDIALLTSAKTLCDQPIQLAATFETKLMQKIYYVGFDKYAGLPNGRSGPIGLLDFQHLHKGVKKFYSHILSKGHTRFQLNGNDTVTFDFSGESMPGYSGGVVLNTDGKAIGVNARSWKTLDEEQGVKNLNLIRATSLEQLQQL